MKNILTPLALLSLLFFIGCEDDDAAAEVPAVDCAALANAWTSANEAYFMADGDVGIEECQVMADATVALVESGCEGFSLEEMETNQEELDGMKDGSFCEVLHQP